MTIQKLISSLKVWFFLTLWAQPWQPRLLCSSTTPAISSFSQYALFCLEMECELQLIFSSLDMLGDLPFISLTALLQMWISGLCTEDLSQVTDSACHVNSLPWNHSAVLLCHQKWSCEALDPSSSPCAETWLSVCVTPVSFIILNKQLFFQTGRS